MHHYSIRKILEEIMGDFAGHDELVRNAGLNNEDPKVAFGKLRSALAGSFLQIAEIAKVMLVIAEKQRLSEEDSGLQF